MDNNVSKLVVLITKQRKFIESNFEKYREEICNLGDDKILEFLGSTESEIALWEKRVIRVLKTFNKQNYLIRFSHPKDIKSSHNAYITEAIDCKVMAQLNELNDILTELENNNLPIKSKKIIHQIEYTENREILLDGKVIHRFQSDSPGENLFSYLINNPNKVIELKEIEKNEGRDDISKGIHQKIRDLGFKGKLKTMFFPGLDEQKIQFINPITKAYLNENHIFET
ncbi:MAG: hypothetical protein PHD49_00135 [Candidatus Shapirobacteria bacterium]|nr:hypothetical protein [Candidatus Shapirobacteria bacterium]